MHWPKMASGSSFSQIYAGAPRSSAEASCRPEKRFTPRRSARTDASTLSPTAIYCLYDASKQPGSVPLPPDPEEADVSSDSKPAFLQIVPARFLGRTRGRRRSSQRGCLTRGDSFWRPSAPNSALTAPAEFPATVSLRRQAMATWQSLQTPGGRSDREGANSRSAILALAV